MKLYMFIPTELLGNNLTNFWNHLERKLIQEYPNAYIMSNYTGIGTLEIADVVLFLYEYKDNDSCKQEMERCKNLGKMYRTFKKFYVADRLYYPQ